MGLIESAPSWCSPESPKPEYKNDRASAFWDVPVYAEKTEVRANRIDARDELPVDGKQEIEGRRENLEVHTTQMGDPSAVPTL